jgi:hypothetical protein
LALTVNIFLFWASSCIVSNAAINKRKFFFMLA